MSPERVGISEASFNYGIQPQESHPMTEDRGLLELWEKCDVGSCNRHKRCMYLNHPRCPRSVERDAVVSALARDKIAALRAQQESSPPAQQ